MTSIGNKARQVTALGKHDKKAKLSISLSLLLPCKESKKIKEAITCRCNDDND